MKRTRRRAALPRYRLLKTSGRAVVTLNGRDFYLGQHNSKASKDQYERLIAEWLANGRRLPADVDTLGLTLNELILAYREHVETYDVKNGKPTSVPGIGKYVGGWAMTGIAETFYLNPAATATIARNVDGAVRCGKRWRIPLRSMPPRYHLEVGLIPRSELRG
jgi:hypothetical protein